MLLDRKGIKLKLVVLWPLMASACATTSVSDLYELYEVETDNDSKRFGYQFILDPAARRAGSSQRQIPLGFAVSFADMRKELSKYMKVYPHCLDGYFVYDESFDGQRYVLHGECQESK